MKLAFGVLCVGLLAVSVVVVSHYSGNGDRPQAQVVRSDALQVSARRFPSPSHDYTDTLAEATRDTTGGDDPEDVVTPIEASGGSEDVAVARSELGSHTPGDQGTSLPASNDEPPLQLKTLPSSEPQQPEVEPEHAGQPAPESQELQDSGLGERGKDTDGESSVAVESDTPGPMTQDAPYDDSEERAAVRAIDVSRLEEQCRQVEADLAEEEFHSRQDLLVMYGRSSAASGRFDRAAASYALFLDEFGIEHPYSSQIAMRLADCLAPLNLDSIDIFHTDDGPRFNPQWRMGFTPQAVWIRQAVAVYELAAELAEDDAGAGRALFRIGWVYRALDDWSAATDAWDRCADYAAGTKWAADALWLAAENLAWIGQPDQATERLRQMVADFPEDARAAAVAERLESLKVEANRSPDWLAEPVASLQAEIETRADIQTPNEVYRSVVRWLRRSGESAALIAISRWACGQPDWPVDAQIRCRHDLVGALLLEPNDHTRLEAVERLGEIVDLAPDNATAVPAAIRCYRLLGDLGRFDRADHVMEELTARVRGSARREPGVLTERIESLLARGDNDLALAVLDTLIASHPDYEVDKHLVTALMGEDPEE